LGNLDHYALSAEMVVPFSSKDKLTLDAKEQVGPVRERAEL
jgi:hypothetical protein